MDYGAVGDGRSLARRKQNEEEQRRQEDQAELETLKAKLEEAQTEVTLLRKMRDRLNNSDDVFK